MQDNPEQMPVGYIKPANLLLTGKSY